ncbi:hypothetical protein RB195_016382 [Necator americanus]|uniref:Uncharacterized protein n=1 Tax=Necator americanus TaxID=51031 RepID=A0ABR1E8X2_NECAM
MRTWTQTKNLNVIIDICPWSNRAVERFAREHGCPTNEGFFIDVAVRLTKASSAGEHVSKMRISDNIERGSAALAIMDRVYGAAALGCHNQSKMRPIDPVEQESIVTVQDHDILSSQQHDAIGLGIGDIPIAAIQAGFRIGKTVVGAIIAARWTAGGVLVLATASTNAAVSQFTATIYVSNTAAQENFMPTSVDMNKILVSLGETYADALSDLEKSVCN